MLSKLPSSQYSLSLQAPYVGDQHQSQIKLSPADLGYLGVTLGGLQDIFLSQSGQASVTVHPSHTLSLA